MSETTCYSYNDFGTTEGKFSCGDVMKNNAKMAAMMRNIAPTGFKHSHYIGLVMSGKLSGSTICSTPATYEIICGEKPVNDVAGMWYAQNGDLILYAPNGRIRLLARDIDLYAEGDGNKTGWVNIDANATISARSKDVEAEIKSSIGVSAEASMNFNTGGEVRYYARDVKYMEAPDVAPLTGGVLGSGSNTIKRTAEGLFKLIESLK
tara:strand:+ start:1402 stop:2022 length:621 start_codon:yes stop_codon:yes gene_type:complete